MKISVIAHPRSSKKEVICKDGVYHIYVIESATDGHANDAIIEELAQYFEVAKSLVTLVRGGGSKQKIFSIEQ